MKVRDVIKLLELDGWYKINVEGDHRQYKHPVKRGRVTVAGHFSDELHPKTLASILSKHKSKEKDRRSTMYRFLIIIEEGQENYSAYAPDLPGCVATGHTREEVEQNMRGAIAMHLQGMIEDHEPIPSTQTIAEYIDVSLPNNAA